jgi:hypothetical protein
MCVPHTKTECRQPALPFSCEHRAQDANADALLASTWVLATLTSISPTAHILFIVLHVLTCKHKDTTNQTEQRSLVSCDSFSIDFVNIC